MIYTNLPVSNTRINIQIPKCQWQKLGPFDHGNCCVWELTSSIYSWDDRSVFASFGCVAKSLSPSSAYIYIYVYIYITLHLQSRHNLILNWGILPYAPPNDSKVGEHNSNFTIYGLWYLQLPIISCMGFRHVSTIFPSPRGPGLLEGLHQQVVRLRLDDFGQVRVAGVDVLKAMEVTRKTTSIPWGFPAKMVISWWFNGI